ncbi:MAG: SURF1 family protein [Pseudomonadota bacterium]
MKNQEKRIGFSFNVKMSVFVVLMLPILIKLGMWQLDRAEQKRVIETQIQEQQHASPLDICTLEANDTGLLQYQPVVLNGVMTESHVLVDNQTHKGKVGYEVIQLVNACNTSYAVSRGFVQGNLDRRILPNVDVLASHTVSISGYLYKQPANRFIEDAQYPDSVVWPMRLAQLDLHAIGKYADHPVFPMVIRLQTDHPLLFDAHWMTLNMKPEKHTAYAVQWFGLALLLFGLFIKQSVIRR